MNAEGNAAGGPSADRRVAVITGAASGIGAAFVRLLAGEGYQVVGIDRDGQGLEAIALEAGAAWRQSVVADLADPAQVERVADVIRRLPRLDVLINNAGFLDPRPFADEPVATWMDLLQVSIAATVRLSHAAAVRMAAARSGTVINLSSVAAYFVGLGGATYGGAKGFTLSFSRALHDELRPQGVYVQALCPGFTRTRIFRHREQAHLPASLFLDPARVAAASWRAAAHRRAVCLPGWQSRVVALAGRTGLGWKALGLLRRLDRPGRRPAGTAPPPAGASESMEPERTLRHE